MQAFANQGFRGKQLEMLNLCRMWTRTITLSDLTTGFGRTLINGALSKTFQSQTNDTINWPHQHLPTKACWKLWERAILQSFIELMSRTEKLIQPLGPWLKIPDDWKWFFCPLQNVLIYAPDTTVNNWKVYQRLPGRTRVRRFERIDNYF